MIGVSYANVYVALFHNSVDQFFECFDELRSSQSALGNSGMWNWTCSVFSAITAASNLASGSLYIPSGTRLTVFVIYKVHFNSI